MHYLDLKNVVNSLLILFLSSISSENPFCNANALSRYYPEVIGSPLPLINCNEKSLTIQQKLGKYCAKSYGSTYYYYEE